MLPYVSYLSLRPYTSSCSYLLTQMVDNLGEGRSRNISGIQVRHLTVCHIFRSSGPLLGYSHCNLDTLSHSLFSAGCRTHRRNCGRRDSKFHISRNASPTDVQHGDDKVFHYFSSIFINCKYIRFQVTFFLSR
jgi:hypothetical protein